jgi:acyl-CoA thioester hydrolase
MQADRAPVALPRVVTVPQVRFSDTDMMGHVSSMSYAAWAEVGRADFFQALGDADTPWFVLVRLALDCHSEGRFGEPFAIETLCARVGNKSLTLTQRIHVEGRPVCTIEAVLAGFDMATRRGVAVPPYWRPTPPTG